MAKSAALTSAQRDDLLAALAARFAAKTPRVKHPKGLTWEHVVARLGKKPEALRPLFEMERTGGEPDVTDFDAKTGALVFTDCSAESPAGRRSVCFDPAALESRKEHKPKHSAVGMAEEMGIELLDEAEYRRLQTLGAFDLKTSSWIRTPEKIRKLKGALFCDRRYDTVFVYHNGAESYYGARGFRGKLRV